MIGNALKMTKSVISVIMKEIFVTILNLAKQTTVSKVATNLFESYISEP